MILPAWFFDKIATISVTLDGRDATGSLAETPSVLSASVPCCVQQDEPPVAFFENGRRQSVAKVTVFFRPSDPPGATALASLRVDDAVSVQGFPNPLVLDGPPFDESGQGVVWRAAARDYR